MSQQHSIEVRTQAELDAAAARTDVDEIHLKGDGHFEVHIRRETTVRACGGSVMTLPVRSQETSADYNAACRVSNHLFREAGLAP